MPEGVALGVLLCALVIAVAVGALVSAVFLRAAVAPHNKLAGGASSPASVPEPTFGKAMWITFAASVAQFVVGSLIGLATGAGATGPGGWGQGVDLVAQFLVSILILAGVLSAKLPTTFTRAILVTLCYALLVLLVVVVLVGIVALVFGVGLRGA